jgi:ribulose-phosphate 3-epimerase
VHVESKHDVAATLRSIRAAGCTCGISVRPKTPFKAIEPYLHDVDLVLIMTVEPGFGGQSFMPEMISKILEAERLREERGYKYRIEVDGGINAHTAVQSVAAGADTLVAGTSVFGVEDMAAAIHDLRCRTIAS